MTAHAVEVPRPIFGLSRIIRMRAGRMPPQCTVFPIPFGWRARKVPSLASVQLMPWWLFAPLWLWENWDRALAPLLTYGFLIAPDHFWERFTECRPTLKWWLSFHQRRRDAHTFGVVFPPSRWESFGYRVEAFFARMDNTMARWTA